MVILPQGNRISIHEQWWEAIFYRYVCRMCKHALQAAPKMRCDCLVVFPGQDTLEALSQTQGEETTPFSRVGIF